MYLIRIWIRIFFESSFVFYMVFWLLGIHGGVAVAVCRDVGPLKAIRRPGREILTIHFFRNIFPPFLVHFLLPFAICKKPCSSRIELLHAWGVRDFSTFSYEKFCEKHDSATGFFSEIHSKS